MPSPLDLQSGDGEPTIMWELDSRSESRMLQYDGNWRYVSPGIISLQVVAQFRELINTMCLQTERWETLEHFKENFALAAKRNYHSSSSEDWASSDLREYMGDAAENAPLFIEAFYKGCAELKDRHPHMDMPNLVLLNRILHDGDVGFQIDPPNLVATRDHIAIPVAGDTDSLEPKAKRVIADALRDSERLLDEGSGRRAVQELLWLLETVSTAFRGDEILDGRIHGGYFNKIIAELRRHGRGHQDQILNWMMALHGYLSAPKGGGIRHGVDLKDGLELSINEARLCCNLIRSYLTYLISEHDRLSQGSSDGCA